MGGLEGGRVVYTIARHRDDIPLIHHLSGDSQFLFRSHPRVYGNLPDQLAKFLIAHVHKLPAR